MGNIYKYKIFEGLKKKYINNLIKKSKEAFFFEGHIIIEKGINSTGKLYVIKEGEAQIEIDDKVVAILKEGEYFGEISLITGNKTTASVKAKTNLTVMTFNENDLIEIIDRGNVDINKSILKRLEENSELDN